MRALAALVAAAAALAPAAASAHPVPGAPAGGPIPAVDPWLTTPLLVSGFAFWLGSRAVWRAAGFGRGVSLGRPAAFWAGWAALALSFASPLHGLGERLFAAHMLEHQILVVVAAPLIAFAGPGSAILWSLPPSWRPRAGAALASPPLAAPWAALSHPVVATTLQAAALWGWHAPPLYAWALRDAGVHRLEHLSFFLAAFVFWWSLYHGRGRLQDERSRDAAAIACLFVTVLHSGLIGALMTLSTRVLYPEQEIFAAQFSLSPLEDQQIAGLVMWVPMGMIYTAAALHFAGRLLAGSSRRSSRLGLAPETGIR